jgi:hypothetical protein
LESAAALVRDHLWIATWWALGRLAVFAAAVLVHEIGPHRFLDRSARTHVFGALAGWDGRWYRMIASNGYLLIPGHQSNPAFFPLYPILLRALHTLGVGYEAAGLALSNGALLVTLIAFHAMTREYLGGDVARRATVYVAIFPLGYVFSMSYPESLVLGAISLAGFAVARARWSMAAICAAVAALARPEGLIVLLPVLIAGWRRGRHASASRGVALGAVLAPVAALASFPAYLSYVLHDPLAWTRAEQAWGRRFSPLGFARAVTHLHGTLAQNPWLARDVICFFAYIALLVAARRAGTPLPWLVGGMAVLVLPLFSGSFTAIGRFGLLVPPLFWGLAWLGRQRTADRLIRVASLALLVAMTLTIPYVFP